MSHVGAINPSNGNNFAVGSVHDYYELNDLLVVAYGCVLVCVSVARVVHLFLTIAEVARGHSYEGAHCMWVGLARLHTYIYVDVHTRHLISGLLFTAI